LHEQEATSRGKKKKRQTQAKVGIGGRGTGLAKQNASGTENRKEKGKKEAKRFIQVERREGPDTSLEEKKGLKGGDEAIPEAVLNLEKKKKKRHHWEERQQGDVGGGRTAGESGTRGSGYAG